MSSDPRQLAFQVLKQARTITLDQALDRLNPELDGLSPKDKPLCTAIAFGVLRHQGLLDHLIRTWSNRPFEHLDPDVVLILRIGLFQIRYLDRVPDFAAIHTSIDLAKARVGKKAAGFINAVLRQAAQNQDPDLPDPNRQLGAYLRVAFSIPRWLGDRWVKRYGRDQTLALCQTLMQIAPLTLRTNTLKTCREDLALALDQAGIRTVPTPLGPDGLDLFQAGRAVTDLPGFSQGWFQVQDEAAQLVSLLLGPRPGDRVLDACAGLGGKACHLGQLMANQGQVLATDIEGEKLERLEKEALRLGLTCIQVQARDISSALAGDMGGYFDRVLVDAPCTGLGVIRRNPDTRWKRELKDIQRMAAQQKKILNAAANLVRPGGILVFAVCSCEPEENQGVITHFLDRRKDFQPDLGSLKRQIPGLALQDPSDFCHRTYPEPGTMDGFFMARMKRKL